MIGQNKHLGPTNDNTELDHIDHCLRAFVTVSSITYNPPYTVDRNVHFSCTVTSN